MTGAFIYLVGSALPIGGAIPLIGLAATTVLSTNTRCSSRPPGWPPLTIAVGAFLCSLTVSTMGSADLVRSLRLSTPFLPALLLFIVLTVHVCDIRTFYLGLSAINLAISAVLVAALSLSPVGVDLFALVPRIGIPILLVPNDVTVLAVFAPLSLMLLEREPRGPLGVISATSLLLSVAAIFAYRSRTAAVTMMIGMALAIVLSKSYCKSRPPTVAVLSILLLECLLFIYISPFSGPSLLSKFREAGLSGRAMLWGEAWTMFINAPLIGHGPHAFGLFHTPPWPHNIYLELLAEQGLLGLSALAGVLGCGIFAGWKLTRSARDDTRYLAIGALAGLIGMCSAGVVELTLAREWVVTTLFLLLGTLNRLWGLDEVVSSTEGQQI
jgi:O-antigen ligase